ncbi:GNAT family N-acetyltransferase [Corynebacterium sp. CCM 9204]|uniref:GNAT family N-acetyltransferase n=1 Tax=Corynebacterium sp. CCM 9204 TaxID=3057616 RepID=UPI003523A031
MTRDEMLELYDNQLRTEAEVADAPEVTRIGPLWVATYVHRHAFITYRSIPPEVDLPALIELVREHFTADGRVDSVEWKTREHDDLEGLENLLTSGGFQKKEPETVMAGPADAVIEAAGPLPDGYSLVQVGSPTDIQGAESLVQRVFGAPVEEAQRLTDQLVSRSVSDPGSFELWVVREPGGGTVCTGRTEFVAGTEFAGLWGGACDEGHRGRGLYRALTAARASSAQRRGYRYLQADCTEDSRPILERAGLMKITTTTPFVWERNRD